MKTEVLVMLFGFIAATIAYSMDWDREQDKKISDIDKLIVRQQVILDMQIKINEITTGKLVHKPEENKD